jgi:hypothetical protein
MLATIFTVHGSERPQKACVSPMELCRTGMRDRSGVQDIKSAADCQSSETSRRRLLDAIPTKGTRFVAMRLNHDVNREDC